MEEEIQPLYKKGAGLQLQRNIYAHECYNEAHMARVDDDDPVLLMMTWGNSPT
jgi:hypothetical protein